MWRKQRRLIISFAVTAKLICAFVFAMHCEADLRLCFHYAVAQNLVSILNSRAHAGFSCDEVVNMKIVLHGNKTACVSTNISDQRPESESEPFMTIIKSLLFPHWEIGRLRNSEYQT